MIGPLTPPSSLVPREQCGPQTLQRGCAVTKDYSTTKKKKIRENNPRKLIDYTCPLSSKRLLEEIFLTTIQNLFTMFTNSKS